MRSKARPAGGQRTEGVAVHQPALFKYEYVLERQDATMTHKMTADNLEGICRAMAGENTVRAIQSSINGFRDALKAREADYVVNAFLRKGGGSAEDELRLESADSFELSDAATHIYFNQFNTLFAVPPGKRTVPPVSPEGAAQNQDHAPAAHGAGAGGAVGKKKDKPRECNTLFIKNQMGTTIADNMNPYICIPVFAQAVSRIVERALQGL